MKAQRAFLEEAGLDLSTYKELMGIHTRNRSTHKPQSTVTDTKQERKKQQTKKEAYIPPTIVEIPAPALIAIADFQALVQELYRKEEGNIQPPIHISLLHQIHEQANLQGGIVEVSSIGAFDSIVKSVLVSANPQQIFQEITLEVIQEIRQLLFSIQFIYKNDNAPHRIYQLGLINFVQKDQLRQHIKDKLFGLKYFNYDLTLFQEGAEGLQIDKSIFNLDYMCKHYGKQKIDIRIQNPLDYGFKPSKLKNKKYEMTLGEYRFYQMNFLDVSKMKNFKHVDQLGKGQVFFGVNFQPSDQMLNREIKKNVEGTFLDFHGDFDLMSYLDTDVPGCSIPQMYFKTPGCWTGGHQQNISMSALNINHGPDYSQWFTLQLKYVELLRKQLLQKFQIDLYSSEGLWYQKLDWFIERGYPVKRFLQRKDDIVVTGPGTLHWVRSFGVAIQTSWNIFPKNYQQFEAAFNRHRINKEIRFHKSDTIPFKNLIVQYLNHERTTMPNNIRQICANQLEEWLNYQINIVQKISKRIQRRVYFYLKHLQSFCSICKQQVLVYFFPAPVHMERGISCLSCFQKQDHQNTTIIQEIYYKLDYLLVQRLIQISKDQQLNIAFNGEIEDLCQGIHAGELPTKCVLKKKVEQKKFILQSFGMNQQQEILAAEKEIYYNNQDKFQLYQNIDNIQFQKQSKRGNNKSKEKLKPNKNVPCGKMMGILEQGEMIEQSKQQVCSKVDVEIQTEGKYKEVVQKQLGQISSQSIEKKKKKKKSKSKKKKQKSAKKQQQSDSPKFKTSDEQCKAQVSQPKQNEADPSIEHKFQGNDYRNGQQNDRGNNHNEGYGRQGGNWRNRQQDNYNNRDNQGYGQDNYRQRNNQYGEDQNQEQRGNWTNRNNYNRHANDRNEREFGNQRNYQNENGQQGQFGRRRNFNDRDNNRNFDNNRERNFDGRGRGRGRGDRGRGRGRGGYWRDNDNQDRNNNEQTNQNNNEGVRDNENENDHGSTMPKCDEPDEY